MESGKGQNAKISELLKVSHISTSLTTNNLQKMSFKYPDTDCFFNPKVVVGFFYYFKTVLVYKVLTKIRFATELKII
jgi:hypothetical protein